MEKSDVITIKKSRVIYSLVVVVIFLVGFYFGGIDLFKQTNSKAGENCKKFCEFIPDTEFSYVGSDNHCYCLQKNQRLTDNLLNKTLSYTRIVDAGIITDVEIK